MDDLLPIDPHAPSLTTQMRRPPRVPLHMIAVGNNVYSEARPLAAGDHENAKDGLSSPLLPPVYVNEMRIFSRYFNLRKTTTVHFTPESPGTCSPSVPSHHILSLSPSPGNPTEPRREDNTVGIASNGKEKRDGARVLSTASVSKHEGVPISPPLPILKLGVGEKKADTTPCTHAEEKSQPAKYTKGFVFPSIKNVSAKRDVAKIAKTKPCMRMTWDRCISWSRRQELERRLQGARLLSEAATRERRVDVRRAVKVVIVGAGMAGLSAAHGLQELGFRDVIVLEGSDRIGGRIHTVPYGTEAFESTEMGVSYLDHPETWNTVYDLANSRGLLEKCLKQERYPRGNNRMSFIDRKMCFLDELVAKDISVLKRYKSKHENNVIRLSSQDYFRETLRRYKRCAKAITSSDRDAENLHEHVSGAITAFYKNLQYQHGDNAGDADIQNFATEDSNECLSFPGGMTSLLEPLTKGLTKGTVRLNAKATRVDWSSFTAKNVREKADPMVTVTCRDGRAFKAHHVIMAVPLGHLKAQSQSLFHPPLPDWKLEAVDAVGFGAVGKVAVQYQSCGFPKGSNFFVQPCQKEKSQSLVDKLLLRLSSKPGSCIFEATFSDAEVESVKKEELVERLTQILEDRLGIKLPEATKVTTSSWKSDELFGGTHPYLKKGRSWKDVEALARPVTFRSRPVVQFAGDATHPDYTSLLHAARASGLREVERLGDLHDDLYGLENSNTR